MRGLGRLSDVLAQALFPVPQELGLDERTKNALQKQSLMQLGLGMMGAKDRGAGLGQGLNMAYQQAQQGLGQGVQQSFIAKRSQREDQRLDMQDERAQRYDTRQDQALQQQALDRATQNARYSVEGQKRDEQNAQQQSNWERQFKANQRGGDTPVNNQMITRPVGAEGMVQDFAWNPRTNTREPAGEPYKPATTYQGNVQEGERKAAVLGTRLESSLIALGDIEKRDPGASRPGILEKAAAAAGSEMGANWLRSDERQQANVAQLDALDAALTLATGAAYTKDQLENLRTSYFPQIGDSDATVKAKEKKFATIVEGARIAAGRAAPSIDRALGDPGRSPAGTVRRYNPQTGKIE